MWKLLLLLIGAETVAAAHRCSGIDNGCCTVETPCFEGDGDCDNDDHCAEGLVCGDNNCPWGDGDECCINKDKGCEERLKDCKFPFTYKDEGVPYHTCANPDNDSKGPWCSTKLNANGVHVKDHYQYCGDCIGKWSDWTDWGVCSMSCGGGEQKRERECVGGKGGVSTKCDGDAEEVKKCNEDECPEVCGEWVSECSVPCGSGIQTRSRECEKGGVKRREKEKHKFSMMCRQAVKCEAVCGDWKIAPCTVSCGGGEEIHTRECTYGIAGTIVRKGTEESRYVCNDFECPLSCRPTLGGNSGGACCTFPFTYKGQTYNSCNGKGWHEFWCATTGNYDTDGKWGECEFEHLDCMATFGGNPDPWQQIKTCHFPFIYRGKKVNSCINTRHDRLWCGTTANYDSDGYWGNCLPGGLCHLSESPYYYHHKK